MTDLAGWSDLLRSDHLGSVGMVEFLPSEGEDYRALIVSVGGHLTAFAARREHPWNVLISSEENTPVHRAVGFWKRYGDFLGAAPEIAEASSVRETRLVRVGAVRMPDAEAFSAALLAPWRVRFRRIVLLPRDAESVPVVLDWIAQAPDTTDYHLNAHLLRRAVPWGLCFLTESETERHTSSITVYGPVDEVTTLASTIPA